LRTNIRVGSKVTNAVAYLSGASEMKKKKLKHVLQIITPLKDIQIFILGHFTK